MTVLYDLISIYFSFEYISNLYNIVEKIWYIIY